MFATFSEYFGCVPKATKDIHPARSNCKGYFSHSHEQVRLQEEDLSKCFFSLYAGTQSMHTKSCAVQHRGALLSLGNLAWLLEAVQLYECVRLHPG